MNVLEPVEVGVGVGVLTGVLVGVGVFAGVGELTGVFVGVGVLTGVLVSVGVVMAVGVEILVLAGVLVKVGVEVGPELPPWQLIVPASFTAPLVLMNLKFALPGLRERVRTPNCRLLASYPTSMRLSLVTKG